MEIDRLSQLPDVLLLHIFSFLPFEYWILMSIVSTRFHYLWTHTPRLDFDMEKRAFGYRTCHMCGAFHGQFLPVECLYFCIQEQRRNFFQYVDRAIRLHSGDTIDGFRLSFNFYDHLSYVSMIDRWVSFTLTRNIRNLELSFDESNSYINYQIHGLRVRRLCRIPLYSFPRQRFAPKMLTTMILHSCRLEAFLLGTFANLKYLTLKKVDIVENKITKLLSKFPLLCHLCLQKCVLAKGFFVREQVVKIEHLDIINCMTTTWLVFPIDIIAPRLSSFTFVGVRLHNLSIRNAKELKSAQIDINYRYADRLQNNLLASLLKSLIYCSNLELGSWCIQVLSTTQPGVESLQLESIRNLSLNVYVFKKELPGIYFLLKSCPKLETLTLNFDMYVPKSVTWVDFSPNVFAFEENEYWELQDFPVECLQKTLKTITIYGFKGQYIKVEMLKFILERAMVLETLYLHRPETCRASIERNEKWEAKVAEVYTNLIEKDQIASGRLRLVIS